MAILLIFSCILLCILAKMRSDFERKCLEISKFAYKDKRIKKSRRFVYLSDLHEECFGENNAELISRIRALKPDAVLLGGDLIVCRKYRGRGKKAEDRVDNTVQFLHILKQEFPVYFALGNHERRLLEKAGQLPVSTGQEYPEEIRRSAERDRRKLWESLEGIFLLDGQGISLGDIRISALDLDLSYYRNHLKYGKKPMGEAETASVSVHTDAAAFNIVLLHTPMYYRETIAAGADLVLSGHYHGGTIRLPFIGALMTPQYQFFVRECAGEHHYGHGHLVVTRGLGTHSIRIRLNDKPEICLIQVGPDEGETDKNGKDSI